MKKSLLTLILMSTLFISAKAQLNLSAGATYTNYGGDISASTPGLQIRGVYNVKEKLGIGLGLSYNLPIKDEITDGSNIYDRTSTFVAANLYGVFHLIGTYEDNFSLYFPISAGYVFGKSKYKATTTAGAATLPEDDNLSGLTVNGTIGLQFKIGVPFVFAEAGFALAANNTTNSRTGVVGNNPVPSHSILSLGIRLPLGGSSIY